MHRDQVQLETVRRVAVFRALQLGDLLVAVPALRALRTAAPRAEITLIGLPWAHEFAARFAHLVDSFIPFPGHPALPEREPDVDAWPGFLAEVAGHRFDLAIQLHGSGEITNPIVALFGARQVAGFVASGAWRPGIAVSYPEHLPESERLLALVEALGAKAGDRNLEFPLTEADHEALRHAVPNLPASPLVVLHPGARSADRRWPAASFAAVASALALHGFAVCVTGTAAERPITAAVLRGMDAPALDLTGKTSLGALAALLSRAALLVSNDTGVAHLAAALRTPSVVIYSASDPARWYSGVPPRQVVIDARTGADPGTVIRAALALLGAEAVHA